MSEYNKPRCNDCKGLLSMQMITIKPIKGWPFKDELICVDCGKEWLYK